MTLQSYGAQEGAASAAFGSGDGARDGGGDGGGGAGTAPQGPGPAIVLASRARRWVARFVDGVLFLSGTALVFFAVVGGQAGDELTPVSTLVVVGAVAVVWLLLFPFALAWFETTVGKALVGLRVVRMRNGKRIGFWRATWRELSYSVLAVVPFVGWLNVLSCLWDQPYRQCWHDKLAGTITVDQSTFTVAR